VSGEVIKSFLVGLGFDVDEGDLSKFNKALASATLKVTALSVAVTGMAAGVAKAITSISSDFEDLGYELHVIAPAINKALVLRQEMLKAYAAAGVNFRETAVNAIKLNLSLAKTKIALNAIYQSVGSRFFTLLTKQSDLFRKQLYANMPKIQAALEKFVKFIFKAFEAVTRLGTRVWSILTRVYDFFVQLDKATNGWSTIILSVIAAWKLLNLSFLATPLGMIIAGLVAILALFDDFKTWQEGGQSLFDWSKFVPVIEAVTNVIKSLKDALGGIVDVLGNVIVAFYNLFHGNFKQFFDGIRDAVLSLIGTLGNLWESLKGAVGIAGAVGKWAGSLFGDSDNAGGAANVKPIVTPPNPNVQNSNTNQNVNQQTNINIMGTADAHATGRATASQQDRVNQNLTNNLKSATR